MKTNNSNELTGLKNMPTFLGIGVQRAATTWLHDCLAEHPQVFVPPQKELSFFNTNYNQGLEWYLSHFQNVNGRKAIGEITPLYLHEAPMGRIAEILPSAKILLILREPISRARSAYELLRLKAFPNMDFETAIRSPHGQSMISCSKYAASIRQLLQYFSREQILFLLYNKDVCERPADTMAKVYSFLGVDPNFRPAKLGDIRNRIMFPRAQEFLARMKLGWAVGLIKDSKFGESIRRISKRRGDSRIQRRTAQLTEFYSELRNEFHEDILETQQLIDRDLSDWLRSDT